MGRTSPDIDPVLLSDGILGPAELLEAAVFDQDRSAVPIPRQDAGLAVVEMHVSQREIARFEPDARSVAIAHLDTRALKALDGHVVALDDERGFAFYRDPLE